MKGNYIVLTILLMFPSILFASDLADYNARKKGIFICNNSNNTIHYGLGILDKIDSEIKKFTIIGKETIMDITYFDAENIRWYTLKSNDCNRQTKKIDDSKIYFYHKYTNPRSIPKTRPYLDMCADTDGGEYNIKYRVDILGITGFKYLSSNPLIEEEYIGNTAFVRRTKNWCRADNLNIRTHKMIDNEDYDTYGRIKVVIDEGDNKWLQYSY